MIIGIDPGITGAIVPLIDGQVFEVIDLPVTRVKVGKSWRSRIEPVDLFHELNRFSADDTIVLEEVTAQGRNGSLANFGLGRSYGVIETAVAINFFATVVTVSPRRWKRDLGLDSDKKASLALARTLFGRDWFPLEKHDGRAEAALLAHWYLTHGGITP